MASARRTAKRTVRCRPARVRMPFVRLLCFPVCAPSWRPWPRCLVKCPDRCLGLVSESFLSPPSERWLSFAGCVRVAVSALLVVIRSRGAVFFFSHGPPLGPSLHCSAHEVSTLRRRGLSLRAALACSMLLRGCVILPRYGRADAARTAFPCGGLAASVLAKRWPQPRTAWLEWLALFFFLLLRVWRRFSARGAFARMELTRGAWLLALVLLAAATGEAAISSKAGVTDTDAGLLCVVSGALKGGARQAQVDTARAFTLMSAIAAHRAGPGVAKGAQPALAKMSAGTKQEAVAASQRATHALASLERQKARAAALAQAIATSAAEAATLSAHIAGEMDQWARIASTLASKATSGFPCITTNPSSNAGTITVTRNLVAATEPQSGSGTANGKPVPAECDA
ncbi:hypothetical protein, conserved in T. vivax, partial [Trypanosoma vivax Y486]